MNSHERDNRFCPLCTSSELSSFLNAKEPNAIINYSFELIVCKKCRLIYLNPKQRIEDFSLLYPSDYYKEVKGAAAILENFFLSERKEIVEAFKKKGSLLDIGCGDGKFLKIMARNGWSVSGVETAFSSADTLDREKYNIYYGILKKNIFKNESFDVITMWQVLEHLGEPKEYLTTIYHILRQDGILVISIPNIDSFQARFSRSKWFHLDLPRHRWHFTPQTILGLLCKCNFYVKKIDHFSIEYNPFGWWQSLFNVLGCEMNFVYKYFKRGRIKSKRINIKKIYTILCIAVFTLPFLFIAFVLSYIENIFKKGGIITIVAVKNKK